jgi:hypothetical protein
MSIYIKILSTALLIISIGSSFAQTGSQSPSNINSKFVVIYRYNPHHKKDHKVKAIAFLAAKCYYFKKVPHVQIGKPLSAEKGKYIADAAMTKFMSNLTAKNFENINKRECNCGGITEETYIIEISSDGRSAGRKIFYVPVVTNCPVSSPCAVIGIITDFFSKLKQNKLHGQLSAVRYRRPIHSKPEGRVLRPAFMARIYFTPFSNLAFCPASIFQTPSRFTSTIILLNSNVSPGYRSSPSKPVRTCEIARLG